MTETKHTLGPWYIGRDVNGFVSVQVGDSLTERDLICDCYTEENATLIAAAPDMYEALQWIVENADEDSVVSAAKAALAKARGEGK
jgi:hypothetical protein